MASLSLRGNRLQETIYFCLRGENAFGSAAPRGHKSWVYRYFKTLRQLTSGALLWHGNNKIPQNINSINNVSCSSEVNKMHFFDSNTH